MPKENPIDQLPWIQGSFDTRADLEVRLNELYEELQQLDCDAYLPERGILNLNIAELLLALGEAEAAWQTARPCVDYFVKHSTWDHAIVAFDLLYRCDQPKSIAALGMGCWLAITYPVDVLLSLRMLNYFIDETPDSSDGAAVAAAVAYYIADLRADIKQRDSILFQAQQTLAAVAKRHRDIEDPEIINVWMDMYELKDPASIFTPYANYY